MAECLYLRIGLAQYYVYHIVYTEALVELIYSVQCYFYTVLYFQFFFRIVAVVAAAAVGGLVLLAEVVQ